MRDKELTIKRRRYYDYEDPGYPEAPLIARGRQPQPLFDWLRSTVAVLFVCMFHARADVLDAWHSRDGGAINDSFYGVAYGNGKFVVTGYFKPVVLTSADGVAWTISTIAPYAFLRGVVWGNGLFVAVGNAGKILTSSDGVSWQDRSPATSADLEGVTYANGKFVAVGGGGEIWISTSGTSWALGGATSSTYLRCVTWGNGLYVAAGNGGGVFTSTNGYQWTAGNSGRLEDLEAIAYGNGLFVSVGNYAPFGAGGDVIITSPDGATWTTRYTKSTQNLTTVAFGEGVFVAGRGFLISTNGVNWETRTLTNATPIYDLTYGRGTFLGVGDNGTIVQSDLLLSLKLDFTSSAELIVSGLKGRTYRLESANDLRFGDSWSNRAAITLTNSPQQWLDPESGGVGRRFYRAVWPPY